MTGYLVASRSDVIASAAPMSGGITNPWIDDGYEMPMLVLWGGESDLAFDQDFDLLAGDMIASCLDHGWWISFAGNVTYPKAQDLASAAERVPLDRLLVETDAPYLPPQEVRKHRNQPAYVFHTARFVAERRGIAYEELEAAVEANAARLLGW